MSETNSGEPVQIEYVDEGHKGAFVVRRDGEQIAELTYTGAGDTVIFDHTRVDDSLRGQGVGVKLVEAAVDWARANHKSVIPLCPFAKATFERRADLRDMLKV